MSSFARRMSLRIVGPSSGHQPARCASPLPARCSCLVPRPSSSRHPHPFSPRLASLAAINTSFTAPVLLSPAVNHLPPLPPLSSPLQARTAACALVLENPPLAERAGLGTRAWDAIDQAATRYAKARPPAGPLATSPRRSAAAPPLPHLLPPPSHARPAAVTGCRRRQAGLRLQPDCSSES